MFLNPPEIARLFLRAVIKSQSLAKPIRVTLGRLPYMRARKARPSFIYGCGIVAYIGNEPARDYLIEGLDILRSRGYDSAGISTVSSRSIDEQDSSSVEGDGEAMIYTSKYASVSTCDSYEILRNRTKGIHRHFCGIGHTRWATHGSKTDVNAHPHEDETGQFSLVHNGTIENSYQLRKKLKKRGVRFASETDSEVVVQLISSFYEKKAKNFYDAVCKSLNQLSGTYGLAIICKDFPGKIIAVRKGSPLVIGIGTKKYWIASEYTAFSRHTSQYISLKDGEIAVVGRSGMSVDTTGRLRKTPDEIIDRSPSPYIHWTIKEIMELPNVIDRAINYGGRFSNDDYLVKLGGLSTNEKSLMGIRNIVICACGSSYYAALYVSKLMRELKSFEIVQVVNASDFDLSYFTIARIMRFRIMFKEGTHKDKLRLLNNSALLVISQSGETKDVYRSVQSAKANNILVMAVVNNVGSLIASESRCGVYTNSGREFGVASTKSFFSQVIALCLISVWFSARRNSREESQLYLKNEQLVQDLHQLSFNTISVLKTRKQCQEIAYEIRSVKSIFVLGKGSAMAIAKEAALKIKEMCYIHAEGFSGGELKHGPFALIEEGTPVFIILLDDSHSRLMRIACEEILARRGQLFVITDNELMVEGLDCKFVLVRKNGTLTSLLCIILFQLIAYEAALLKGINPDKPRNLAKSVTVD